MVVALGSRAPDKRPFEEKNRGHARRTCTRGAAIVRTGCRLYQWPQWVGSIIDGYGCDCTTENCPPILLHKNITGLCVDRNVNQETIVLTNESKRDN
jgi:hypothetical protein